LTIRKKSKIGTTISAPPAGGKCRLPQRSHAIAIDHVTLDLGLANRDLREHFCPEKIGRRALPDERMIRLDRADQHDVLRNGIFSMSFEISPARKILDCLQLFVRCHYASSRQWDPSGRTPGLPQCFIETAAFDASLFVSLSSRTGIKRTSPTLARWQSGKNKIRE
jgi:hypothetical protein